jgi:aryl-alcohol dehydrogenase-like predicted oxidoreductase
MTFGEDWGWGAGPAESRRIFGGFDEAGGNFIDTACNYTNGSSERIVGDCVRGDRDRFVIATKYTLRAGNSDPRDANLGGNSARTMARSVEGSLQRLGTDHVDLLYLHMWDFTTPIAEVLAGAHRLVMAGKVHYFAFSDTPAWVVSEAVARAEAHGWPGPVAVQAPYSLRNRDVERDVWPMARAHGLAMLAWGVLGGGALTGKYDLADDTPRRRAEVPDAERAAGAVVARLARELGCSPAQLALAWAIARPGNLIPILGCRTRAQLDDNLGALAVELPAAAVTELDALAGFDVGFPLRFLDQAYVQELIHGKQAGRIDRERSRGR